MCAGMYIESLFDDKMGEKINKNSLIAKINKFSKFNEEH